MKIIVSTEGDIRKPFAPSRGHFLELQFVVSAFFSLRVKPKPKLYKLEIN